MPATRRPRHRPYPLLDHWGYRLSLRLGRFLPGPGARLRAIVRVANRASGISFTVFFGLLSVFLFVIGEVTLAEGWRLPGVDWVLSPVLCRVFLVLASLAVAYLAGGLAALGLLSPDRYAYAVVAGNSRKEMLRLISSRSRRLCIRFVFATRPYAALSEELLAVANHGYDPRQVADGAALADELRDIAARHEMSRRQRLS